MKLYTDGTCFFKTDNYIKNLRAIEINNLYDFVKYGFRPEVDLFKTKVYCIGRFDEIFYKEIDEEQGSNWANVLSFEFLKRIHTKDIFICMVREYKGITLRHMIEDLVEMGLATETPNYTSDSEGRGSVPVSITYTYLADNTTIKFSYDNSVVTV